MSKKFFTILFVVTALFTFSTSALAQGNHSNSSEAKMNAKKVVWAAPKRKTATVHKRVGIAPKLALKKSAKRPSVHRKAKPKATAKKSLFWQMALNPFAMTIWVPLFLLLIPVSIQIYRQFPWRETEDIPVACQEEITEDDSSWDQRAWDRIKELFRWFRRKPILA